MDKKGQAVTIVAAVAVILAAGVFLLNIFGVIGAGEGVEQTAATPTGSVIQVSDTQTVELRAFQEGLNLNERAQLALSYVVWRNDIRTASGTLSASAGTDFVGEYNARYDWAVYDDNGAGSDYYLTEGSLTALPAADYELSAWQEATSSDITVTFLENDGTPNDGTIAIGNSSSKVIQMQLELGNLNLRYQDIGACVDYDEGNFSDISLTGPTVSDASEPRRLDGNEQCFDLGVSLPTESEETIKAFNLALSAAAGAKPVQNVTITLFDKTKYIDPKTNIPSANVVAEDNNRVDVGAGDITTTLNVQ